MHSCRYLIFTILKFALIIIFVWGTAVAESKGTDQLTGKIWGYITGEDGKKIAGATFYNLDLNMAAFGEFASTTSTLTNSEGYYELTNIPHSCCIILATMPGFISRHLSLEFAPRELSKQKNITLIKGERIIEGRITDKNNQPISQGEVICSVATDSELIFPPAKSDSRGNL